MISPALTTWPPYRFTPSRWALESRPFLVEAAPFLCAIASSSLESGPGRSGAGDTGDLDCRVVLAVTLAPAVTGLALELHDVDLRALCRTDYLSSHVDLGERGGVRRHRLAVDDQHRGQRQARPRLRGDLVNPDDVSDSDLLLAGAAAHDRVHRWLTLV